MDKRIDMKKRYIWIIGLIVFLVALRMALPYLLKDRINKSIDAIEGYNGGLEDVDLQLYRGGFHLEKLKIYEEASSNPEIPIVDLAHLDFSIHWKSLFKGSFVGEVYMDTLLINFTKRKEAAKTESDSTDTRVKLIEELQGLNPILINIFEIKNSKIAYKDPTSTPTIDVALNDFYLKAENLGNVEDDTDELPAKILLKSTTMDSGTIQLDAEMNYLLDPPDFDFDFEIERLNLPRFNEFFEAYANLGLESGHLNFYAEGKARSGDFTGYVKPLIENLEIAPADSSDGLFQKIYEGAVEIGTEIFENQKKDQIGTRVPISGSLDNSKVNVLQSVWNFVRNAFFDAYKKEIERSIGMGSNKDTSTEKE